MRNRFDYTSMDENTTLLYLKPALKGRMTETFWRRNGVRRENGYQDLGFCN